MKQLSEIGDSKSNYKGILQAMRWVKVCRLDNLWERRFPLSLCGIRPAATIRFCDLYMDELNLMALVGKFPLFVQMLNGKEKCFCMQKCKFQWLAMLQH